MDTNYRTAEGGGRMIETLKLLVLILALLGLIGVDVVLLSIVYSIVKEGRQ